MRIYKSIKDGKVSNHYDLKKATMNHPDIVFAQRGLIVPIGIIEQIAHSLDTDTDLLSYRNVSQ